MSTLCGTSHARLSGQDTYAAGTAAEEIGKTTKGVKANEAKLADEKTTPEEAKTLTADIQAADAKVDGLSGEFPESPKVQTAAGKHWFSRGNLGKAEEAAGRAVSSVDPQKDPALASEAMTLQGLVGFQKGDFKSSLEAARKAHELDPKSRAAFELMKYSESALNLRELKGDPEKRTERILALQVKNTAKTPKEWAEAQDRDTTAAGRLVMKVIESKKKGDLRAAMEHAESAVKADPNDPMAYFQRGRLRSELKDRNGAILDFSRAIAMGWTDPTLFKLRAEALFWATRYKAAIADADLALAYDPKMASAYFIRASAKLKLHSAPGELGKFGKDILADLEEAAKLDPRFADELAATRKLIAAQGTPGSGRPAAAPAEQARNAGKALLMTAAVTGLFLLVLFAVVMIVLRSWRARVEDSPMNLSSPAVVSSQPIGAGLEGRTLGGRYKIGSTLGRGGMGEDYEAEDEKLGRKVAIKRLTDEAKSAQGENVDLIMQEARTVAELKHENILEIHDLLQEDGEAYCVFELVSGSTVADRIKKGRIEPAECIKTLAAVCSALDYAHSRKLIHRDLKPANIMVDDSGRVKVMDFGIARHAHGDSSVTMTQNAVGSPAFMAPELEQGVVSPAADIFALGVTAYQMLTGTLPFTGAGLHQNKLSNRFAPASSMLRDARGLDTFFQQAMNADPAKRFANGAQFLEALSASLGVKN